MNTLPPVFLILFVTGDKFLIPASLLITGILIGFAFTYIFYRSQKIGINYFINTFGLSLTALKLQIKNILFKRELEQVAAEITTESEKTGAGINPIEYKTESDRAHRFWLRKLYKAFINQTALFTIPAGMAIAAGIFNSSAFLVNTGLILAWLVFAIITVLMNRHLMPYHFIPLSLPLSILAGQGFAQIYEIVSSNHNWIAGLSLVWIIALPGIVILGFKIKYWIAVESTGRGKIFNNDPNEWVFYNAGEKVGRYLKTATGENDKIYVWGAEHEIYIWAGRSAPTWDLFCPRLKVSFTSDPMQAETYILEQLQADLPKYIIVTAPMDDNPRFVEFLQANYELERKMFGEIEIHLRKELQEEKQVVPQLVQEPLVSIIMLTWNALDYTRQCIDSIRVNTNHPHEIIFVDNASTDGTVDYLNKLVTENENYNLIANPRNRGFAAGNNQGMDVAQGDYLMLLNNDVLVPEGWLERLVRCAEIDSSIGLVGPLTNWISGLQMIENITYSDPADSFEYARRIAQAHQGKYTPRRRLAGFALLISRALYERIGGLDEHFGSGNYEDDDYCLQATAAEFKIMVAEDVFIHHFGSVSFESNDVDYNQAMAKNRGLFRDKWPQIDLDWLMERDITLVELNNQIAERAQVALEKQKCTEAIELYQNILKTNPVDDRALYGMGLAYYMQSDNQKALEIFQRITNLIPEFSAVHANIGSIYAQSGDISLAITSLNRAVELDPHNLDAQVQLAEILLLNDQVDSGAQVLKLVLEADPQHIGALNRMGILMLEINRKEKAQRYFEIALQLDPNNKMAERHLTKINEL